MAVALLICRVALMTATFAGFCAMLRVRFNLNHFIAPFLAASAIIILLMIAGILGVLEICVYALYLTGFIGLLYAYVIKRNPPPIIIFIGLILFTVFLIRRFSNSHIRYIDNYTHWGTIVRFIHLRNRFPVADDKLISHQSYPPGLACFIYYIVKLFDPLDSYHLMAQYLLFGLSFLPVFSIVKKSHFGYYPLLVLAFLLFFFNPCRDGTLLVDDLQAFWGIGIASIILRYRNDPDRALRNAILPIIAAALFKNSGLFFSFTSSLILLYFARRKYAGKRRFLHAAIALGASAIALLLWSIRVKIVFPSVGESPHAISLSAYAARFAQRGFSSIFGVAKGMLVSMASLKNWRMLDIVLFLSCALTSLFFACKLSRQRRHSVLVAIAASISLYIMWLVALYFMYLFSMNGNEALVASCFYRYNTTGVVYMNGLLLILLLLISQSDEIHIAPPLLRVSGLFSFVGIAYVFILAFCPVTHGWPGSSLVHVYNYTFVRNCLMDARANLDLTYGNPCMFFYLYDNDKSTRRFAYVRNNIKYELGTDACYIISADQNAPSQFFLTNSQVQANDAELLDYIAVNIDTCEAFILLDESPEFEAVLTDFLQTYRGDTPIYRAYEEVSRS